MIIKGEEKPIVSNTSIIMMGLSGLIAILFPIGLAFYLYKRYRISGKALLVGALVFFIFQMVMRIPLLGWLGRFEWYRSLAMGRTFFNYLYFPLLLAVTAGIFEETGRFFGLKYLLRNELRWENGLAFGVGHGGIESILITGMTMINNIVISLMINTGKFESQIGSKLPTSVAQSLKSSLIDTSPWLFAAGGLERILAVTLQIGFSLLVLYSVISKRYRYLAYAVVFHAVVDFPAGLYQMKVISLLAAEFLTLLLAIVTLFLIEKSKPIFQRVKV